MDLRQLTLGLLCLAATWGGALLVTDAGLAQPPLDAAEERELVTTPSGLQYLDVVVGDGRKAQKGDMATIHYSGWLKNGTKFDSSRDQGEPYSFPIGAPMVIAGLNEGVSSMREGGKRTLIIPPHLGYGSRGVKDIIPPNATLMFEIELLELQ